jgi:APA family basic amino acid/polyamine antiporter
MSEYIALVWPNTEPIIRWMAISILIILVGFHWLGTKSAGKSQEIMSFLKAIGLFAFIAMCFIYGGDVQTQDLVTTTQRIAQPALLTGLIIAFQQVFYAFDGWHTAAYFTEENTDPAKNLPKSMISGVLVVIAIYLLVNLAILYIMPIETLATSKLAAADAIRLIFGEKSGKIVTFFLMVSILGMLNAQIMFAPRVIYSMSKDGLFFKLAQKVNSGGTPAFAMPLTGICSILLIISGKDTCERLSDIAVFFFVMTYAAGFASVIMLRRKEPNLPRPYKVIGYPSIPFVLIIISIMFLIGAIYSDINSSMYALIFLVLSYPLFLMTKNINL